MITELMSLTWTETFHLVFKFTSALFVSYAVLIIPVIAVKVALK